MTVGDTIQSKNGAGFGGVVTSWNGQSGAVDGTVTGGVTSVDGLTGVVDLTTKYLQLTGGTLTGLLTATKSLAVAAATSSTIGVAVVGASGQSANLTSWYTSTLTEVASVNAAGVINGSGFIVGTGAALTGGIRLPSTTQINWRTAAGSADIGGFSSNASDQLQMGTTLVPNADGTISLGSSTRRWAGISAVSIAVGTTPALTGQIRLGSTGQINFRNAADNADIAGWSLNGSDLLSFGTSIVPSADNVRAIGSTSARLSQVNTAKLEVASTGALGTVETFRAGATPTTVDNAATSVFGSSGTGNKVLVAQAVAGQTANIFEAQTSAGAGGIVASISAAGALVSASVNAGSGAITTTGTVTGTHVVGTTSVRAGVTVSSTGAVRLASTGQINWRNAADSADIGGFSSNAGDLIQVSTDLVPSSDSSKNLGSASLRYATVFGVIGTFGAANPAASGAIRMANTSVVAWRNAANNADVSALSVNSSNVVSIGGAGQGGLTLGTPGGGTGTTAIMGASSVTISKGAGSTWHNVAPTTTHALADTILTPTATTQKPLVIQALSASAAALTEWQNSTAGTVLASVSAGGTLSATGITSLASAAIVTGGAVLAGTVRVGATPYASAGEIRLTAGNSIRWRNNANNADLALTMNAGDYLVSDVMLGWVAGNEQTTVGAAGAATALPAQPTKYLKIKDSAGTTLVVPAYAAA
ncbi:MAG: beta strand repeat-containing protein [Baekduiaceae bacterium]